AGNVDEYIRDTDGLALAAKIGDPNVPAGLVDVPDFTEAFVNAMNARPMQPLPALALRSDPPYSLTPIINTATQGPRFAVKELPKVVVPTEVAVLSGRSQIIQPSEKPPVLIVKSNNANAVNQN